MIFQMPAPWIFRIAAYFNFRFIKNPLSAKSPVVAIRIDMIEKTILILMNITRVVCVPYSVITRR